MDENDFFREATLRICGNLEIEKALTQCLLIKASIVYMRCQPERPPF